ncbi:MAG: hypothetical protein ACRD16_12055 [Thermoanaerobaculia bacterium]
MSESIVIMASDGLLEFEEKDIQEISVVERGVEVLLKTGLGFLLVGHEAAQLLESFAGGLRSALARSKR